MASSRSSMMAKELHSSQSKSRGVATPGSKSATLIPCQRSCGIAILALLAAIFASLGDELVEARIPPPLPLPKGFLDPHNAARADVNVSALQWNLTLAEFALGYGQNQRDHHGCAMEHSPLARQGGPYGENLFWGSNIYFSSADAVNLWVSEKAAYDYTNNVCVGGFECRHYTQVVWGKSTSVGCAAVPCRNGGLLVICEYYPRGNVIGVKPY